METAPAPTECSLTLLYLDTRGRDKFPVTLTSGAGSARIEGVLPKEWACGAAGSALPWHGRGHRFDPDQVHQTTPHKSSICRKLNTPSFRRLGVIWCHARRRLAPTDT